MTRAPLAAAVLAAGLILASCGDGDKPARRAPASTEGIELRLRSDPGTQRTSTGELTCRPGVQRASGALVKRAHVSRLCSDARALASLLTAKEPARRVCTRIYGGPQSARITGTIDGHRVDRTFKRTDGCEIAEYARVSRILPR